MLLALGAAAIVAVALLWDLVAPRVGELLDQRRARRALVPPDPVTGYDPGRERRAEAKARELLRSCVNDEEWAMYRDLGFLRVWGTKGRAPGERRGQADQAPYAYLVYPHKPIVCYLAQTRRLLSEHCVAFPDESRPYGSARLPDSDDVLAKWMLLTSDEERLVDEANMHLPGRQVDPEHVRRDLWRLTQWEQRRAKDLLAS